MLMQIYQLPNVTMRGTFVHCSESDCLYQAVGPYPMMYIHNSDIAYNSISLLLYNAIAHCMTSYSNLMLFFIVTQIQNADKV